MSSIKGMIPFNSYEKLLGSEYEDGKLKVVEVPIESLHTFENHPFHVNDDEEMQELVDSIKEKGVVSPAIVRERKAGGYEIISGHRRKRACEIAGLEKMPVIIRELDDKEATILMVDSNIPREHIPPTARAFAYKMRMKYESHQGERTDLTSGQIVQKLTSDDVGEEDGFSGRTVRRYVCLTELIPELLEQVDEDKIGFIAAVDLSFLDKSEQKWVWSVLNESHKKLNGNKAKELRSRKNEQGLTEDAVCEILLGRHTLKRSVSFSEKELKDFFPDEMDAEQIKTIIMDLILKWKEESQDG